MGKRFVRVAALAVSVMGLIAQHTVAQPRTAPSGQANHLVLDGRGTTGRGEKMALACGLDFATIPSNTFTGECRLTVGGDQMTLTGLGEDGAPVLTVVLNGQITVRGSAHGASGRFQELTSASAAGFPVYVEMDPLARSWAVRGYAAGQPDQAVASGSLEEGKAALTMP